MSTPRPALKILVLEPYYGGSHQSFLTGLAAHLPGQFDRLTLPARKWKWRMRLAAPCFAAKLAARDPEQYRGIDAILCSTFVDLAAFRALAPSWARDLPALVYFHENQFAYPVRVNDERDFHFALTNLTTALAADRLAFNSRYNLESFLAGARELLKIAPDMRLEGWEESIREKSLILPPGVDFSAVDAAPPGRPGENPPEPVIIWNHRWEHDKNPELFFRTLYQLAEDGIQFQLIVLGESFQRRPEVFAEARKRLAERILHFGYVESRREYCALLKRGSLVASTARHEFFGIAVLEAVRAGCRPLLPRRLSYPELFPAPYLYADRDFAARLREALALGPLPGPEACSLTEPFSWPTLAPRYRAWVSAGARAWGGDIGAR